MKRKNPYMFVDLTPEESKIIPELVTAMGCKSTSNMIRVLLSEAASDMGYEGNGLFRERYRGRPTKQTIN